MTPLINDIMERADVLSDVLVPMKEQPSYLFKHYLWFVRADAFIRQKISQNDKYALRLVEVGLYSQLAALLNEFRHLLIEIKSKYKPMKNIGIADAELQETRDRTFALYADKVRDKLLTIRGTTMRIMEDDLLHMDITNNDEYNDTLRLLDDIDPAKMDIPKLDI